GTSAVAVDRFTLDGPAAGSIDFTASLRCLGQGGARASLMEGLVQPILVPLGGPQPLPNGTQRIDDVLRLHLRRAPGAAFDLVYAATAGMSTGVSCQLSFDGLPAGYSIHSCHGFQTIVSVRQVSWGQIKSMFR